jgi:hypothetical protein
MMMVVYVHIALAASACGWEIILFVSVDLWIIFLIALMNRFNISSNSTWLSSLYNKIRTFYEKILCYRRFSLISFTYLFKSNVICWFWDFRIYLFHYIFGKMFFLYFECEINIIQFSSSDRLNENILIRIISWKREDLGITDHRRFFFL